MSACEKCGATLSASEGYALCVACQIDAQSMFAEALAASAEHRTRLAAAEGRVAELEAALVSIANLTTGRRAVISASVHDTAMAALAGAAKKEG